MKKRMAGIIIFTISTTLAWSQTPQPPASNTHWEWVLVITPQTTKHYLDSVITTWRKDSIILNFSMLKYNGQGKLVKVKGTINVTAKGRHASGTFAPDKLESFEIKANDGPGVSLREIK